jgi:hypothetical protein
LLGNNHSVNFPADDDCARARHSKRAAQHGAGRKRQKNAGSAAVEILVVRLNEKGKPVAVPGQKKK